MEMTSLIVALIGMGIACLIFYLFNKTRTVSKNEFENLNAKYNENITSLKLHEDRLNASQQLIQNLTEKVKLKEDEVSKFQTQTATLESDLRNSHIRISEMTVSLNKEIESNNAKQSEINIAQQKIAELTANNSSLTEKLATHKQEIEEIQKTAHLQFEKIANQIFEEKSTRFTATNKTNIESLLNPLKEDIGKFKTKVEETYDKESKQRFSLEEKVKDLIEQTNKVSSEANNLATALKGQTKKQGNWGEMILERILETSGLTKDREYFVQQNIKDDEGKNLRPDIIVNLPDERVIIIDSKVSLIAYDRFSSTENIDEQKIFLADHMKSIYTHIDDLSSKKYDNLETSLDFTMMFVPIEPAYMISIQADQELWAYAYTKRILLISPTNLIACLKLIFDLWKREKQSKNAMEIVKRGELLYDKFVTFVGSLEEVGKHISKSQTAYNTAVDQLKNGKGNLVGQAMQLQNLGLKSNKKIPSAMLPMEFDEEMSTDTAFSEEGNDKK